MKKLINKYNPPAINLLLYLLVGFLITILSITYLFLNNMPEKVVLKEDIQHHNNLSSAKKINLVKIFIKNKQLDHAFDLLNKLEVNPELKNKQRKTVYLLQAQVKKKLGLFNTTIAYIQKSLAIKKPLSIIIS